MSAANNTSTLKSSLPDTVNQLLTKRSSGGKSSVADRQLWKDVDSEVKARVCKLQSCDEDFGGVHVKNL